MSPAMRARVIPMIVTAIAAMMALRDRRGGKDADIIMITITIKGVEMVKGRVVERGREECGVRMHMKKCLRIKMGVQRERHRVRIGLEMEFWLRVHDS